MPRPIQVFALATLSPVLLLLIGAASGGIWAWIALLYITLFAFILDQFTAYALPEAEPGAEFPAADDLSVLLAGAHFILLFVAVYVVSGHTELGLVSRLVLFFAFGLFFGQISNSNAHELIHRSDRRLFLLGQWVFISLLFGQHTSAHRHVHHRYVGTAQDPNTAMQGESYWEFLPRAWIGAFRAGLEVERALRRQSGASGANPYVIYLVGELAFVVLFLLFTGLAGGVVYLLLSIYAQMQLMLSDYVQHYGLERALRDDGRPEPVSERHSWNSANWFSSALMLNAPRHSAHHAHPSWPYPELTLPGSDLAPRLPYSLPVMATIALFPSVWFGMMDRRLSKWQDTAG